MKRKLIAFMAAVLALISLLPVSASAEGNQRKVVLNATCAVTDINVEVTIPAGTTAYINPKQISVKIGGTIVDSQVLSDPAYIENKSTVPISVSASVTGSPKGDLILCDSSTKGAGLSGKEAFIYFEMLSVDDPDPEAVSWAGRYHQDQHIIVHENTEEKEGYVRLEAGSQENRYGVFRLAGDCVANPADDPWSSRDGVTATIVFTFRPLAIPPGYGA